MSELTLERLLGNAESDFENLKTKEGFKAALGIAIEGMRRIIASHPSANPVDGKGLGGSEMNNALCEFALRWDVSGDWMVCRSCKRQCVASRADENFMHAEGCKSEQKPYEPRPWRRFMELLAPLHVSPTSDEAKNGR